MGRLVAITKPKNKSNRQYGSFEPVCKGRLLWNHCEDSQIAATLVMVLFNWIV